MGGESKLARHRRRGTGGIHIQVSIDGPAGAGKSSVARALAKAMGYVHIDSGAMYRAVTLLALREGVALEDEDGLSRLAKGAEISFRQAGPGEGQQVYCRGENVTVEIRSLAVSQAVSTVAAVAGVREALVGLQRQLADQHDVVMDGRDIGTVVLPQAPCKIYLTATPEERARRRLKERAEADGLTAGQSAEKATEKATEKAAGQSLDEIVAEIMKRDEDDMNRANSPLRPAEDSVTLDSTSHTFQEVVDMAAALVRQSIQTLH